ncbi:hypothetical protein PRZ48_006750 [Zasmidium cellare]|uniref:Uncharacterized protein n=1 Tax=Zasmidium cellare TaxID=395010 RepID=A0ABR0EHF5_ZASCE|nr:hypothetical protein PRZ48_006750 [Zasmidium cellare]
MVRRRMPSGQIVCCDEFHPDEKLITCRGQHHADPTLTHKCCATIPDQGEEFLCDICLREIYVAKPFTQSSQEINDDSSQGTQGEGYGPIIDSRINERKNNRMEYLITRPNAQLETWIPEKEVPEARLREFEEGIIPVSQAARTQQPASQYEREAFLQPLDLGDESQAIDQAAGNPFWKYLKLGYWALALATHEEAAKHSALKGLPGIDIYRIECVSLLASIPHRALLAILGSGLTKQKLTDEELRADLQESRNRSVKQPNCYHLELCDPQGNGPTIAEMRKFCSIARRYAWPETPEDGELAIQIDQVKYTLTEKEKRQRRQTNARRYLSSGPQDNTRKNLRIFLENLELELDKLSGEDDNARVPFLLNDIGYTDDGIRRIEKDHTQHKSSNDLMNLWEAISVAFYKEKKYRMRGDVIHLCCKKGQAPYSEILFSILTQSYISTGKGFNGAPAGISQNSLGSYDSLKEWTRWKDIQLSSTPYYENMRNEAQRVVDYKNNLAAADDRLAEEELQLALESEQAQKELLAWEERLVDSMEKLLRD